MSKFAEGFFPIPLPTLDGEVARACLEVVGALRGFEHDVAVSALKVVLRQAEKEIQ